MTRNASFKRRIRARMARTGEKYNAARRVLIAQAAARDTTDGWVSHPEHSDDVIRANTGRGWDEWVKLVEDWTGHEDGHGAVAAWIQEEHGIGGWWAQSVTVGWERITGRRLPHQMTDGTFTVSRSATVTVDHTALRALLLDADGRATLFPGLRPQLRSRPTSQNLRVGLREGVVEVAIAPKGDGRATVTIAHAKLPDADDVVIWKAFWGDWLGALDEA